MLGVVEGLKGVKFFIPKRGYLLMALLKYTTVQKFWGH